MFPKAHRPESTRLDSNVAAEGASSKVEKEKKHSHIITYQEKITYHSLIPRDPAIPTILCLLNRFTDVSSDHVHARRYANDSVRTKQFLELYSSSREPTEGRHKDYSIFFDSRPGDHGCNFEISLWSALRVHHVPTCCAHRSDKTLQSKHRCESSRGVIFVVQRAT